MSWVGLCIALFVTFSSCVAKWLSLCDYSCGIYSREKIQYAWAIIAQLKSEMTDREHNLTISFFTYPSTAFTVIYQ
jgi:hypothetical protein